MSKNITIKKTGWMDLFESSTCFSEFMIQFNLLSGRELNGTMTTELFNGMLKIIRTNDLVSRVADVNGIDKEIEFLESMIEYDLVTMENIMDVGPSFCATILQMKDKRPMMKSFKMLCVRFPEKMKTIYNSQIAYKKYCV